MKETPRRRITVTSSLYDIFTDQLGGGEGWEALPYSVRLTPFFLQRDFCQQIFEDDMNGISLGLMLHKGNLDRPQAGLWYVFGPPGSGSCFETS